MQKEGGGGGGGGGEVVRKSFSSYVVLFVCAHGNELESIAFPNNGDVCCYPLASEPNIASFGCPDDHKQFINLIRTAFQRRTGGGVGGVGGGFPDLLQPEAILDSCKPAVQAIYSDASRLNPKFKVDFQRTYPCSRRSYIFGEDPSTCKFDRAQKRNMYGIYVIASSDESDSPKTAASIARVTETSIQKMNLMYNWTWQTRMNVEEDSCRAQWRSKIETYWADDESQKQKYLECYDSMFLYGGRLHENPPYSVASNIAISNAFLGMGFDKIFIVDNACREMYTARDGNEQDCFPDVAAFNLRLREELHCQQIAPYVRPHRYREHESVQWYDDVTKRINDFVLVHPQLRITKRYLQRLDRVASDYDAHTTDGRARFATLPLEELVNIVYSDLSTTPLKDEETDLNIDLLPEDETTIAHFLFSTYANGRTATTEEEEPPASLEHVLDLTREESRRQRMPPDRQRIREAISSDFLILPERESGDVYGSAHEIPEEERRKRFYCESVVIDDFLMGAFMMRSSISARKPETRMSVRAIVKNLFQRIADGAYTPITSAENKFFHEVIFFCMHTLCSSDIPWLAIYVVKCFRRYFEQDVALADVRRLLVIEFQNQALEIHPDDVFKFLHVIYTGGMSDTIGIAVQLCERYLAMEEPRDSERTQRETAAFALQYLTKHYTPVWSTDISEVLSIFQSHRLNLNKEDTIALLQSCIGSERLLITGDGIDVDDDGEYNEDSGMVAAAAEAEPEEEQETQSKKRQRFGIDNGAADRAMDESRSGDDEQGEADADAVAENRARRRQRTTRKHAGAISRTSKRSSEQADRCRRYTNRCRRRRHRRQQRPDRHPRK